MCVYNIPPCESQREYVCAMLVKGTFVNFTNAMFRVPVRKTSSTSLMLCSQSVFRVPVRRPSTSLMLCEWNICASVSVRVRVYVIEREEPQLKAILLEKVRQ